MKRMISNTCVWKLSLMSIRFGMDGVQEYCMALRWMVHDVIKES